MIRLKHFFYTLLLTCAATSVSVGQTPGNERFERIENQKIAYVTKQLSLSTTEAQRFFPVYNQYSKEMKDIRNARSNMKAAQRSGSNGRDVIEFDAREVELKKQYRSKFAEIIGQSRASQFFVVEEEFKEMLYKEWKNRQNK